MRPSFDEVIHGLAGVMVRDGKPVQALFARRRDQRFRAGNAVATEERVTMQVEMVRHRKES